jgi:glutathione S-transferase
VELGKHEYVAGDFFSAADITAMCAYDFAKGTGVCKDIVGANVARWYSKVSARGSSKL